MGTRRQLYRLRDEERASGLHHIRRQVIPSPQLFDRDSEAIANRNQRIAPLDRVPLRTKAWRSARNRNHKLVLNIHAAICRQPVYLGNIACMSMERGCYTVQRLSGAHHMKAPDRALILRDVLDARRENV